jgi:hypothetical protein
LLILRCSRSCPVRGALWVVGLSHALLDVCLSPGSSSRVPLPVRRPFPEGIVRANLLTFAPLRSHTDRPGRFFGLLSWVPSAHPSHVSSEMRLSPLHRHARAASTPATTACRRFGPEGATPEVPFHPRGFSPPRRFPPLHESRACCIPLPILGSTAFLLVVSRSEDRDSPPLPRDAGPYPSKNSSPTAGTRHRVRCPLAVLCPITAASRLFPLPFAGLPWWADRERRLRGLAPSSSLVSSRRCRLVNDPLLPGLRSFSRSFVVAGDPVSCRVVSVRALRVSPSGCRFECAPFRTAPPPKRWCGRVSFGGQRHYVAAEAAPDGAS